MTLWGRVVPHQHGWRAEWAQPSGIYRLGRSGNLSGRLASVYRIPLIDPPRNLGERWEGVVLNRLTELADLAWDWERAP